MKLFLFRKVKFVLKVLCEWNCGKGLPVKPREALHNASVLLWDSVGLPRNCKPEDTEPSGDVREGQVVARGWEPVEGGPELQQNPSSVGQKIPKRCPSGRFRWSSSMTGFSWRTYYDTEVVQRLFWGAVINKTKQKDQNCHNLPSFLICPSWFCFPLDKHTDARRHVVPYGHGFTDRPVIKHGHKYSDGGVKWKRTYQTFEDGTRTLSCGNACGWGGSSHLPLTVSHFLCYLFGSFFPQP